VIHLLLAALLLVLLHALPVVVSIMVDNHRDQSLASACFIL
jgi:hypothetical protein